MRAQVCISHDACANVRLRRCVCAHVITYYDISWPLSVIISKRRCFILPYRSQSSAEHSALVRWACANLWLWPISTAEAARQWTSQQCVCVILSERCRLDITEVKCVKSLTDGVSGWNIKGSNFFYHRSDFQKLLKHELRPFCTPC